MKNDTLLNALLVNSHAGDHTAVAAVIRTALAGVEGVHLSEQIVGPGKVNLIASFGTPSLLINCHMDTVPPLGGWTRDPYSATHESGKVYGLGTADTKGNLWALLRAVQAVRPREVMLLFSFDEESGPGTSGVKQFLAAGLGAGIKGVIVCEPTTLAYVNRHPGYCSFLVTVRGASTHSSLKGPNAIVRAASVVTKLDGAGFTVGSIKGGKRGNILPHQCVVKVSHRSYEDPHTLLEKLRSALGEMTGVNVAPYFTGPPLTAGGRVPGVTGPLTEAGFWSEASLFERAGLPAVVFGAGHLAQAHAPDEYVEVEQLMRARRTFEGLLEGGV